MMSIPSSDERPGGRRSAGVRGPGARAREWLLLTGNRLVVSGVLLLIVAVAVVGAVAIGFAPLRAATPILFLLFALISGNFVLITIVVSLNQFVLSRHLESPDEIKQRMDEMLGYRREVGESTSKNVLPITPSGFLTVLFLNIGRLQRDLEREASDVVDDSVRQLLLELTGELGTHASDVLDLLTRTNRGVRAALFATLNEDYASYIFVAYHLESEHDAALGEDTTTLLARLVRSLEQVDVARRFFKTIFIQSELASLSRRLLYIGLPVQLVTVVMMLSFTAPGEGGPSTGVLTVVIPAIVIAGFAPIVILTAYILRLSTVAQRTAVMYPFTGKTTGIAPVLEAYRRTDDAATGAEAEAGVRRDG
jgi:hypothetical protein